MKIDGSKNTLDSQNGKAYKARRKGFQAKQKYADGPFLRVYYYVRPAVKQKNRPREFPKGGIAWCTLCTGGEVQLRKVNRSCEGFTKDSQFKTRYSKADLCLETKV